MKSVGIFVLSILLLFFGFYSNRFQVADRRSFASHQRDTECLVVGRLVKSHNDGVLSAGGLTGWGSPDATALAYGDRAFDYQYLAYLNGLKFGAYTPYLSQTGGQALILSLLDRSIHDRPAAKLEFFHMLTAFLSALTLTLVVLWFFWEFGYCVAGFVLASVVLSQWLVIYGRNLWWSIWTLYLPMIAVMYFLRRGRAPTRRRVLKFGILVFTAILIKCLLTGYEFITTTLIMMIVPLVYYGYYGALDNLSTRTYVKYLLAAISCSGIAVFFAFTILSLQIASVEGNARVGVDHVIYSLQKRTHADPGDFPDAYRQSLRSSTAQVVLKYLNGKFFLTVRYWFLVALFSVASVLVVLLEHRYRSASHRQTVSLILATWFSILAPISWFVVFKAHSFVHTFVDPIVWQMPFTLFGFAVCGCAVRSVLVGPARLTRQSPVCDDLREAVCGDCQGTAAGQRRFP